MADEPDSLVLQLLRDMRAELSAMRGDMTEMRSEVKSDLHSLRADVASDILSLRKELSDQLVGLRRAVVEYHTSVIKPAVIVSDFEARLRRVEQHLSLTG